METRKDPLAALRRRLEKAELEHLRQHAADLADRLEKMEQRAIEAEDQANWYWQSQMDLIQSLTEQGETLGMTVNGHIGLVKQGEEQAQ